MFSYCESAFYLDLSHAHMRRYLWFRRWNCLRRVLNTFHAALVRWNRCLDNNIPHQLCASGIPISCRRLLHAQLRNLPRNYGGFLGFWNARIHPFGVSSWSKEIGMYHCILSGTPVPLLPSTAMKLVADLFSSYSSMLSLRTCFGFHSCTCITL